MQADVSLTASALGRYAKVRTRLRKVPREVFTQSHGLGLYARDGHTHDQYEGI